LPSGFVTAIGRTLSQSARDAYLSVTPRDEPLLVRHYRREDGYPHLRNSPSAYAGSFGNADANCLFACAFAPTTATHTVDRFRLQNLQEVATV
jgi:hypothetical protein